MLSRRNFLQSFFGAMPLLFGGMLTAIEKTGVDDAASEKTEHPLFAELRDLWTAWDPIGVMHCGCPRDEYDGYLNPTLHYLERGAHTAELEAYLDWASAERMLSPMIRESVREFALQLRQWYAERWSDNDSGRPHPQY